MDKLIIVGTLVKEISTLVLNCDAKIHL